MGCNRHSHDHELSLLCCYCMMYNEDINMTVVGPCVFMCAMTDAPSCRLRNSIPPRTNATELNQVMCGQWKRKGQLCSECEEGHGFPVYSYTIACTNCSDSDFKYNLFKYICVAFLPLTVFYFVVIIFKISITSGDMVGYILLCQLSTSPMSLRSVLNQGANQKASVYVLITFLSVWNLDYFRSVYSPFCIKQSMSTLQVLSLDYLVGLYPLILILLTYSAICLHGKYLTVVRLWSPVHRILACMRKEWNIQGSLVQAFATFLILSYVKILNVSFDLLFPVRLQNKTGKFLEGRYLLNNAEVEYFGPEHFRYGLLAITMLTVFNIFPIIILTVYPCRHYFQMLLSYCGFDKFFLSTFVDVFQGCYRHKPRICRYFAGLYLVARIIFLSFYAMNDHSAFIAVSSCCLVALASAVLFIQPHRNSTHNKTEVFFFMLGALVSILSYGPGEVTIVAMSLQHILVSSAVVVGVVYGTAVAFRGVVPWKFLKSLYKSFKRKQHKGERGVSNEPFAEWEREVAPLLH